MPRPSVLPAVALALAAACAAPTQPGGVQVRPGGTAFARGSAGGAAAVPYTVANDGAAPVRLTASCGDDPAPSVERRAGDGWAEYAAGLCLAIYPTGAVVLAPGTARQGSVGLAEAGEYRLVLATDRGRVASPAFVVR